MSVTYGALRDELKVEKALSLSTAGMRWRGGWINGFAYLQNEVVLDDGWLMVANKQTSDRPAPQAAGDPTYDLPDAPAFVEQIYTGVAWSGTEYTLAQSGWINRVEVWVPELTPDTNYQFLLFDNTDPANPIVKQMPEPVLNEDAWTTLAINPTPFAAGTVFAVVVDALNSGSDTVITGGWDRAANSNTITDDPGTSAWGTQNSQASLRINKTDLDTVDRATELLSIVAGSTVTFVNAADNTQSMAWTVNAAPVDQGTHVSWSDLTYDGPGVGGEPPVGATCQMTADVPVPSPTRYEEIVGHWPTNQPAWGTVRGLLKLGGVDQPADDNAYGVRIEFQPAYVSPDWDLMASTQGSGGGSGGSGGHLIFDEGAGLPARTNLNFVGAGVTATDNAGSDETTVTIPGGGAGDYYTKTEVDEMLAAVPILIANVAVSAQDLQLNPVDIDIEPGYNYRVRYQLQGDNYQQMQLVPLVSGTPAGWQWMYAYARHTDPTDSDEGATSSPVGYAFIGTVDLNSRYSCEAIVNLAVANASEINVLASSTGASLPYGGVTDLVMVSASRCVTATATPATGIRITGSTASRLLTGNIHVERLPAATLSNGGTLPPTP